MVAVKHALRNEQSGPCMRLVGVEADDRPSPDLRIAAPRTSPKPVLGISRHARERRVFPRKACNIEVQGLRLDHSLPALRCPGLTLDVRDLSVGGLSARSDLPLLPGERIAVTFPRQGMRLGWDACGRVLRCEPAEAGYQVAVEFEQVPSAA